MDRDKEPLGLDVNSVSGSETGEKDLEEQRTQYCLKEGGEMIQHFLEVDRWLRKGGIRETLGYNARKTLLLVGAYDGRSDMDITRAFIGKVFCLTPPTVSEILGKLQKGDYIDEHEDPTDRRSKVIELTEKGRDRYRGLCGFLIGNVKMAPIDGGIQL